MPGSNPSTGDDSRMSRAIPSGRSSMMSMRTTSARPFWTTRIAVVAPTNPLPTTVTRTRLPPCGLDVGGPGPHRPQDLVAALHDRPVDRARHAAPLQVPVRGLHRGVLDQVDGVHRPGERDRDLQRALLPHRPE